MRSSARRVIIVIDRVIDAPQTKVGGAEWINDDLNKRADA
jgi:hypothetical protein